MGGETCRIQTSGTQICLPFGCVVEKQEHLERKWRMSSTMERNSRRLLKHGVNQIKGWHRNSGCFVFEAPPHFSPGSLTNFK